MSDNKTKISDISLSKLEWACRRGMLELDLLLGHFLTEVYPRLSEVEKTAFVKLLTYSDPDLFSWLLGQASPPEADLKLIAEKIRTHAKTRISH